MVRARWWSLPSSVAVPLAIVLCAIGATDARAQAPPPTLTGEEFIGSTTVTQRDCDPARTSTIRYESTGIAVGPYPGFYTETGTVKLGPHNIPEEPGSEFLLGDVRSWEASFEIISGVFRVTGTKRLGRVRGTDPVWNAGFCVNAPTPVFPDATEGSLLLVTSGYLEYSATIEGPTGRFTDRGEANRGGAGTPVEGCLFPTGGGCSAAGVADVRVSCLAPFCPGGRFEMGHLNEVFFSSLTAPLPPALRPGKGCGDKNHVHERVGECK